VTSPEARGGREPCARSSSSIGISLVVCS
jgi:hypothetical protein